MKKYLEIINLGFENKKELDSFIEMIADDERLSDRKYDILRRAAINKYFE